jgi:transposase
LKYSIEKRLEAVLAYLDGAGGWRYVAEQYGVETSSLRGWVAMYREHGPAGLEPKIRERNYSAEFKLEVITRMTREGLSYRQTAALFNIRRSNWIGEWQRRYDEGGIAALANTAEKVKAIVPKCIKTPATLVVRSAGSATPTHDELLREVEQLRAENAYLKKLTALVRTKKASAPKKRF